MATETSKRKKSAPITYEKIALRAYELYLQRGGTHGDDLQDWLTAERELTPTPIKRVKTTVAALSAKPVVAATKTVKAARATTTTRRKINSKKESKDITGQK